MSRQFYSKYGVIVYGSKWNPQILLTDNRYSVYAITMLSCASSDNNLP